MNTALPLQRAPAAAPAARIDDSAARHGAPLTEAQAARLADVWSDTVDTRHLALSLLISVPVSAGCFLLANLLFQQWVGSPQIARAYAMLCGLVGCLLGGGICAMLFKPKRIIVEEATDATALQEVIAELRADVGGLGRMADLPPATVAEMKSLGLYELFRDAEAQAEADDQQARHATRRTA